MRKKQRAVRYLYWMIVPIIVLTISLAIFFYADSYRILQDYISELGAQYTYFNGYNNKTSSMIVSVGFGLCAAVSLMISIVYFTSDFRYRILKGVLSLVNAFGASLIAIPQDKGNLLILHTIGAALFIGGFGVLNFTLQLLRFVKKRQEIPKEKKFDYYFDAVIVILVFIVIALLVIFFIPAEITKNPILLVLSVTFQKLVLIVDCLALVALDLDDM
ncbi:MAG: hypothetical protein JXA54_15500 [Candidatus Heimdallarchaeota archaeon]|nr:hypothetical protein [Candidatus Heimdallarchaeota archaeon]